MVKALQLMSTKLTLSLHHIHQDEYMKIMMESLIMASFTETRALTISKMALLCNETDWRALV